MTFLYYNNFYLYNKIIIINLYSIKYKLNIIKSIIYRNILINIKNFINIINILINYNNEILVLIIKK